MEDPKIPDWLPSNPREAYRCGWFAREFVAQANASVDDVLPPRVEHILRLAEIIREVDGNHSKGAAALAEAILSHKNSRWTPRSESSQ